MNIPRYITQLTKEWIKSVSKKLVQGSYIRVDESEDARTVSVDVEGLRDYLGSGNGTVSSVDGHQPDDNGAVSFGLDGSSWVKTDASGHLSTTDETPATVPSTSGYVKSDGTDFSTVSSIPVSDIANTQSVTNVTSSNIGSYAVTSLNGVLTVSNYSVTLGSVYAAKTHEHPVSQITGLDLSNYLTTSDLSDYVKYGDISKDNYNRYTTSSHNKIQHAHDADKIIISIVSGVSKTLNQYFTSDKIDSQKLKIKSNAGLTADSNGLGLTALAGSKWMKTNASGYPTTTTETPVALDSNSSGVLYAENGTLYYDDSFYDSDGEPLYVDTSSNQIVGGLKTFTSGIFFQNPNVDIGSSSAGGTIKLKNPTSTGNIGGLEICGDKTRVYTYNGTRWANLDVKFNEGTAVANISAVNPETTETTSTVLSTCGWVNDKFVRKSTVGTSNGPAAYSHSHDSYVTTNTSQTISGIKTFTSDVTINAANKYFIAKSNNRQSAIGDGGLWLDTNDNNYGINFRNYSKNLKSQIYYKYDDSCLHINCLGKNKLVLDYENDDVNQTNSKVVPTMGWVNDKFVRNSFSEAAAEDKVLMWQKNDKSATWVTSSLTPTEAVVERTLSTTATGTTAQTGTGNNWEYDGTYGVSVWLVTRQVWTGTCLREFRRKFTFSANGLLYSIGDEVVHDIHTPTVITWK